MAPEVLAELPLSTFTAQNKQNFSEENQLCTICQSNYEIGDAYLLLICLHRFHETCIKPWFQSKDFCPICKQPVCFESDQQSDQLQILQRRSNRIQINQMVGRDPDYSEEEDALFSQPHFSEQQQL